jgi:site-specific DNA-cytosine methylase
MICTVAYSKSTRDHHIDHRAKINGEANTISTGDGGGNQSTQNFVAYAEAGGGIRLRKLTPLECERLMGWPEGWTEFGTKPDGKVYKLSKSARYKACGNGVVSVVPETILNALIPDSTGIRIFSTFAGVDGSSMYLRSPKFVKVAFSEFDPKSKQQHAANVLRHHYPDVPNLGDIQKIKEEEVPDHDLMFISAPCQAFSQAGARAGFEDTRGTLFYETARILKYKKPKYFLFENVKGLGTHDKGNTFLTMVRVYSELGYELDFEMVNSKYFGSAQSRERIFMFGRLKEAA